MRKIHSFFAVYISSFCLLVLLLLIILFYNSQSNRIKTLALDSMTLLSQWNRLENETNDLLLNRFTQFGRSFSPEITKWDRDYREFGENLEQIMENPIFRNQPDMREQLAGAFRVWRFTQVRLNNASYYFSQIIKSGLGEKVMVNGLLYTMYQMRMDKQLTVEEIFLLEETVSALENLDNAAKEFDSLFTSLVEEMKTAGEIHLRKVRYLLIAVFASIVLILGFSIVINNQLKIAQQNRKLYLETRKRQLLKRICEDSSQEELTVFLQSGEEAEIRISTDEPILIIMLQIDDYRSFSHRFNLMEQQELQAELCRDLLASLTKITRAAEYFSYSDDRLVFLVNPAAPHDLQALQDHLRQWHQTVGDRHPFTISITVSDFSFETEDLDHDFENLFRISEYRYLLGTQAFITPGSWQIRPDELFRYPLEKERLFQEAFKSLDRQSTLGLINEMISCAEPFGPESMRRLVLRLTAAQSSVVELLEKSYHISVSEGFTPMILEIQREETLREAKAMLEDIVTRVIAACLRKKSEKHDQTVVMVKEMIGEELENLNLSAELIAERFGLSSSYINRLFKQQTSLSIAGFINDTRLRKAEELLRTDCLTVAEVAEQAGFSSMGTFFRLFKKKYGQTPGEMLAGLRRPEDPACSDSNDTLQ